MIKIETDEALGLEVAFPGAAFVLASSELQFTEVVVPEERSKFA